MSVTHFDPYLEDDSSEYDSKTYCGVIYSEVDPMGTGNWNYVSCKRCLRQRKRIQSNFEQTEKQIVKQMGDMADFMQKQNTK